MHYFASQCRGIAGKFVKAGFQPMVMVIDNDPRLTEVHPLANTFDKLEKWFGPGALFGP